ncbi:hypothetical protein HRbin37_02126 [bacterium HR37]|jgi:hypothetical protein|nr:hypothetical protein HRbin37_02126 [bacterium HR37]
MRRLNIFSILLLFLITTTTGFSQNGYRESALSWQKQAKDTRKAVVGVLEELEKIGDKGNPDAKGLIEDTKKWLEEGDNALSKADKEIEKEDYEKASYDYNMAWQYYVKAATAGLNAKRVLTGQ